MNNLGKIITLSYASGGITTFFYVNYRLTVLTKPITNQSRFVICYSSLAHGTYWPLFWSYRYLYP